MDRQRWSEAAYTTRLDVDDAACAERHHVLGALEARNGFVEADRGRQAPLQRRMPDQIVPRERLFDHEQPELVELHEPVAVVECVRVVGVRHQRRAGTERLPRRADIVHVRARLDLDLHLAVPVPQRLARFRDERRRGSLDAE